MTGQNENIFDINLEDFEEQVIQRSHQQLVLLDMWADWCPPCIVIAPILAQLVEEHKGSVALAKIEVDEGRNMKIAGRYHARGFPTIILFAKGEEVERFSGAKPLGFVRNLIDQHR
ncbi:MAG: thioredoxin [Gammaproteobacteria bacterium]|nr:thioredoxin [Gammaproteobacteria bacterium]